MGRVLSGRELEEWDKWYCPSLGREDGGSCKGNSSSSSSSLSSLALLR